MFLSVELNNIYMYMSLQFHNCSEVNCQNSDKWEPRDDRGSAFGIDWVFPAKIVLAGYLKMKNFLSCVALILSNKL